MPPKKDKVIESPVVQEKKNDENEVIKYLKTIDGKLDIMNAKIIQLQTSQNELSNKFLELQSKQQNLKEEIDSLKLAFPNPKEDQALLFNMEYQLDSIKQQRLMCDIIVAGLPNASIPADVIFDKLNLILDLSFTKADLLEILYLNQYRKNSASKNPPTILLLKFKNLDDKALFFKKKKEIKFIFAEQLGHAGNENQIYLRDHLTPYNSMLLREARSLKHNCGFAFLWVKQSKILCKKTADSKTTWIRSKNDLLNLKNTNFSNVGSASTSTKAKNNLLNHQGVNYPNNGSASSLTSTAVHGN